MRERKLMISLTCFLAITGICSLQAAKSFSNAAHGIKFSTSVEFSAPMKIGADALLMVYPKKSRSGMEKMGITAVLYTKEAQKQMKMNDAGLLNYTRSVFMGIDRPGKKTERSFLGKKTKGEVLDKRIPSPSTVEIYIVSLTGGDKLGLGINYIPDDKSLNASKVLMEISSTMME